MRLRNYLPLLMLPILACAYTKPLGSNTGYRVSGNVNKETLQFVVEQDKRYPCERSDSSYERIDKDDNGFLTPEEIRAYARRHNLCLTRD